MKIYEIYFRKKIVQLIVDYAFRGILYFFQQLYENRVFEYSKRAGRTNFQVCLKN